MFEELYQKWRKEQQDNGRDFRVGGKVQWAWDFAHWLDEHAAEHGVHPTRLSAVQKEEVRQDCCIESGSVES